MRIFNKEFFNTFRCFCPPLLLTPNSYIFILTLSPVLVCKFVYLYDRKATSDYDFQVPGALRHYLEYCLHWCF